METDSTLPIQDSTTDAVIKEVNLTDMGLSKKIRELIHGLNANKAHGHDGLSIRMLKICGISISKPLTKIFRNCLSTGYFPQTWKMGNVIPIHKKDSKQDARN